jgi:adenine-specific DNA-methyltransferase
MHEDKKRPYNPPVGLVTPGTDTDLPKWRYRFDPHLDPQLIWSGKIETDTIGVDVAERFR